jgi:translation initiation factor 3 subunit F
MDVNAHGIVVHLHPVAAFAIIDSHERRPKDNQPRVIGSLLGVKNEGIYEIMSAYPVPHSETEEEVAIDMNYEQTMYKLHQIINPSEVVLGWYATNATLKMHSILINDYYRKREPPPVHLTFDCKMKCGHLDIKAYVRCPFGVKTQGVIFSPVPVEMVYYDPERVAVSLLKQGIGAEGNVAPVKPDMTRLENILQDMERNIDGLLGYVEKVLNGELPPDNKIGCQLMELISKVPKMDATQFDKIMNNTIQVS